MSSLHFDPYQFAGRSGRFIPFVNAEFTQAGWTSNGVAYEDATRMVLHKREPRPPRWIPAFAANDAQLRRVLLAKAWVYSHGPTAKKSSPGDWRTVNAAATEKFQKWVAGFQKCPAYKKREVEAHVAAVEHAGGYLQWIAAIAYRAWRLREDSVAIADALNMSPVAVRVCLQRICNHARSLGFETFSRRKMFGQKRPVKRDGRKYCVRFNKERIIALYEAGRNVSKIARALGFPKNQGNNRVREVLKEAGIYRTSGRKPHIVDRQTVISLYEQGKSLYEIASAIGYGKHEGYNRLRKLLKKEGIPYRAMSNQEAARLGGQARAPHALN